MATWSLPGRGLLLGPWDSAWSKIAAIRKVIDSECAKQRDR